MDQKCRTSFQRRQRSKPIKKVYTTGQVAKICSVAPRTVSKWFDSGKLPGYRIPGSQDRRIPLGDLFNFMKENNMPLESFETKVLAIGTERLFIEQLKTSLPDSETLKCKFASDCFQAGMITERFQPNVFVIDLSIGRTESIRMALFLRELSECRIVGLIGEDGLGDILPANVFDELFQKPFDAAILGKWICKKLSEKEES